MTNCRLRNHIARSSLSAALVLSARVIVAPPAQARDAALPGVAPAAVPADTAQPADAAQLAAIAPLGEVVVTAPLLGSEIPFNEVAANIQQISADEISRLGAHDVSNALNQLDGSINLNDTQGNPFQEDLNFRGFTASPVLGTPEGVSVFVDGVRVNEAFGDAVNWDLIPESAIASLEVIPGADPVFGLNTLGGAVTVTTKRGFDYPGTRIESLGGSFGRWQTVLESCGHGEHLDYYLSGNLFAESGWGDHNPSRVRQGFGKLGYRDDVDDVTLAFTYANNRLEGNQTLPRSFLSDPWQSYTWPDIQTDRMSFVDLNASRWLSDEWMISA